ncbi:MAG TPA: YihY/virulence factor BrkB family protein [Steroidobacteraceae bacterium]|jgi:membrane protein|nr:YihY/virulence factor BrkB family protein [Steroidobacteraceae bacterium]
MWARIWALLDWCFFGPASARPGLLGTALRLLRYPYAVVRDLARGEINLRAMGLVYTTLLSLIPLLAFSLSILRIFGGHRDIEPIVYEFFRPVGGAAATELTDRVVQFAHRVSSGVVGSLGLALLAWTLVGTIKKVEDSFNFLWHVDQPRSLARRVAEYTTLLIAGPVLLVAFVSVSHAALASAPVQEMVRLPLLQRLRGTGISLAPYAMVTAFFTALYMLVPNTRVHWRAALTGALVGGVLWAAIGKMFTALVVYSTRLTIVYAGFAFIVAALLWTYFGWLILLAGAQLSFYVQNPAYLRLGLQQLRLSSVELEQLALKLMYFVGRSHVAGGRRWSVNGVADELGLPGIAVAQMAATLERAGLLIVTDDDELVPARDISRIDVHEILDIARNQSSGHVAPRHLPIPPVDRLLESVEEARRNRCGTLTLRDLVDEAPRPALHLTARQTSGR